MIPTRNVELRCYPKEDGDFLAWTQRAVAESRERARTSQKLLDAVQKKLRGRYPNVKIWPRDTLANPSDEEPEVWYCYRDGGWVA